MDRAHIPHRGDALGPQTSISLANGSSGTGVEMYKRIKVCRQFKVNVVVQIFLEMELLTARPGRELYVDTPRRGNCEVFPTSDLYSSCASCHTWTSYRLDWKRGTTPFVMSARFGTQVLKRHLGSSTKSWTSQHVPLRQRTIFNVQTLRYLATVSTAQVGSENLQHAIPNKSSERPGQETLARAADAAAVSISIDGGIHKFSPILLRDLCSCSLCVDQSTRQKLFVTADVPLSIGVTNCSVGPEAATISWSDDAPGYGSEHKSEIPLSTLRNIVSHGKPRDNAIVDQDLPKRVYWSAEQYSTQCSDIDYDSYMQDDGVLLSALRQLQTHGLVFVTSVPEDEKSVESLAERIGPLKTTFYGRTWDVRSVPQAKNVAYTSQNLGFHMDLLYLKQPPHLQLLHCIRSSSAGGASLFTDSFRAVADLYSRKREQFRALSMRKAAFHYDHPESQYYHQFRTVIEHETKHINDIQADRHENLQRGTEQGDLARSLYNPMDFVSSVAWSPPFQAPFALDRDIMFGVGRSTSTKQQSRGTRPWNEELGMNVHSWHRAAQTFNKLIHRPENIYERLMKPGECVIFDNRRVLHARKAFEVGDAGKERWLRGCYIDKDPYLSRFRTLSRQQSELDSLLS